MLAKTARWHTARCQRCDTESTDGSKQNKTDVWAWRFLFRFAIDLINCYIIRRCLAAVVNTRAAVRTLCRCDRQWKTFRHTAAWMTTHQTTIREPSCVRGVQLTWRVFRPMRSVAGARAPSRRLLASPTADELWACFPASSALLRCPCSAHCCFFGLVSGKLEMYCVGTNLVRQKILPPNPVENY